VNGFRFHSFNLDAEIIKRDAYVRFVVSFVIHHPLGDWYLIREESRRQRQGTAFAAPFDRSGKEFCQLQRRSFEELASNWRSTLQQVFPQRTVHNRVRLILE